MLMDEIESIRKSKECLAENKTKRKLNNYCPDISMETIFMNLEKLRNE